MFSTTLKIWNEIKDLPDRSGMFLYPRSPHSSSAYHLIKAISRGISRSKVNHLQVCSYLDPDSFSFIKNPYYHHDRSKVIDSFVRAPC